MLLSKLLQAVDGKLHNVADRDIVQLVSDSRAVERGSLFFALAGHADDGRKYLEEAVHKGAIAVVVEDCLPLDIKEKLQSVVIEQKEQVAFIEVRNIRLALARMAATFFALQPREIVAVTGTSGKSSVVDFLRQIWQLAGRRAASIGTIGVQTEKARHAVPLTTLDAITLHKTLAQLAQEGVEDVALEASSHGLKQYRLAGTELVAAGFTNLGRDHMDYHPTVEDYFLTKMRLFTELLPQGKPALLVQGAPFAEEAESFLRANNVNVLTIGENGNFIQYETKAIQKDKTEIILKMAGQTQRLLFPLLGKFQLENALLAAGFAYITGVPLAQIVPSLEKLHSVSGRLELVASLPEDIKIYIDYAHKPEALESVLKVLRTHSAGRLFVVFGCGGDRDKGKRALMGKIAQDQADIVVVTDDNPRYEDAALIRKDILVAAKKAHEIAKRQLAIAWAIGQLRAGDTLLVAGKGHEQQQIIQGKSYHFCDKEEILKTVEAKFHA